MAEYPLQKENRPVMISLWSRVLPFYTPGNDGA
jgi:hypothetical protein